MSSLELGLPNVGRTQGRTVWNIAWYRPGADCEVGLNLLRCPVSRPSRALYLSGWKNSGGLQPY